MGSPPLPDSQRYLAAALAACRRAGAIHRRYFRSSTLAVDLKADASPVTAADRGSEEAIRETLHAAAPEPPGMGAVMWWASAVLADPASSP